MKRSIFTFLMMLLVTTAAYSQAQVGLRAGLNVATVVDDIDAIDGVDEPWYPGFTLGLASSFHVTEAFAIAPELNYSQRGRKYEGDIDNIDFGAEQRYNYLEIPILFRLSFGETLKGYLNAGPSLAYWLGGKIGDEKIDFDDDAKRFELGGAVGGGIQLDTGVGSFLIDLRYSRGFTNMFTEGDFKNQLVGVSLIFLVPSVQ